MDFVQHQLHDLGTLSLPEYSLGFPLLYNGSLRENRALKKSFSDFIAARTGRRRPLTPEYFRNYFTNTDFNTQYIFSYGRGLYEHLVVDSSHILPATIVFEAKDKLNATKVNPAYPYLTVLTANKPLRVFPYIKKYPHIYDHDNARNIFALGQDDAGRIWAGNYQSQLSIINPAKPEQPVVALKKQPYPFMNASLNHNGKMYFVGEYINGGLLQYDQQGNMRKLHPALSTTGYYLYLAPRNGNLYFASAAPGYPVFYCAAGELQKAFIHWKRLDSTVGINPPLGIRSITEDTLGRLWMGHPYKGFAVYDPAVQKGATYHTSNDETPIGFVSSLTDKKGTVWMGSDDHGLWYYNDYNKPATPQNIHQVSHPLLNTVKRITAMAIYKNWLVLGCYNRICLLNLDSFYQKKKTVLRYLNPQETAFTSFTEQNTMLVSKTDGSLWFSTSDMLYQWDISTWLQLPQYKVSLSGFLAHDSTRIALNPSKALQLNAGLSSFDLLFEYLSPDGLPRYTRTAMVRQGDRPVYSEPGMQSRFSYQNLNSGTYTFYAEVFEQDGSTSTYRYRFSIHQYIWQQSWFWVIISFLFLAPFLLWLNALRKKALQAKEISHLNVVSLSSQFRPHFILNALNAIGADLKDKPGAESLISRLGESINLIFNYTLQKKVYHPLKNEWTLVENVIQIHRIIYLPDLEVTYINKELLETYKAFDLPLGILEINVENALLHGLRNKQAPPYNLLLEINADANNLYFTITDNGIGMQRSMAISSYKKHGSGTRNINSILEILNRFNRDKIEIHYESDAAVGGTTVRIRIPLKYQYKY
ncbi:histidine kinase [Niabella drilacis]|uniref:Histidine kinase n=1 Tax=Niabella drilacis (strain DSM 25811 / CCM 8410 / CCUG 62505 / LMG 26954 / E90) TaxID=1285928 RepID=A0A1G6S1T9_NIADE|nr:histidine kinase [Niabella drilacis]SDD10137.1 Histidine kinase [Niabella drilacis]